MENKDASLHKTKRLFFSGVLALSVANILVKVIGLLFKIPIANILSSEELGSGVGLGYFSSSYTVYTWLFVVATAGLPNGISIVISEDRAAGRRKAVDKTFRSVLLIFTIVGLFLFSVMLFGAGGIAALIRNPEARFSMMAIAPTLLFICIMSVLRGYFYGFQSMIPAAVSEVIESLGKLIFGIAGAYYAVSRGYTAPVVAAYATFGITAGVFFGTLYLWFARRHYIRKGKLLYLTDAYDDSVENGYLSRVFMLSVPITLASSVMSLTGLIDVGTMMARLQGIGYSEAEASALYGTYSMLAVPMYNLPVILLAPISSAVIPLLSSMIARGDHDGTKRITESAVRLVSLFIIPCSLGLAAFSYPILSLFYAENSARTAAPLLSVLAAATFFLGLLTLMNSVLQAHHLAGKTVISMSLGAAVKLLSGIFLVGNPEIGIYGVPVGTVLCYLTIITADAYFFRRHLGIAPRFSHAFIRPFCASAMAVLPVKLLLYPFLDLHIPGKAATLLSIGAVALLYGVFLLLFRAVLKSDLLLLPGGNKIYAVLKKRNLITEK